VLDFPFQPSITVFSLFVSRSTPEEPVARYPHLQDRTAVVTGGASGIGAALAAELAANGMRVVVADIDHAGAEQVAAALVHRGAKAIALGVDVSDPGSTMALAGDAEAHFGPVELLCSNAGVLAFGLLSEATVADWKWMSSVNVEGMLNCVQAFLPRMSGREGWRHIAVTTSSHAFISGAGGTGLYSATKHAVLAITEALRAELEPSGIGVTAVCPGPVATRILDSQRNRPADFGPLANEPFGNDLLPSPVEPADVARVAIAAIAANEPLVFAAPEVDLFRSQVAERWQLADAALASTRPATETRPPTWPEPAPSR
jgi:NAD(P)-dependent dehydrogenase (short-subunit alcohol dehydrogenase family)